MIYIDNSATTKQYPQVTETMMKYMEEYFGNPSSMYQLGLEMCIRDRYTTLQMAEYMATLGNGGIRNSVSLTADVSSKRSRQFSRSQKTNEHIQCIIRAMTGVTEGEDGSLRGLFESFPYTVAAKTGTAQRTGFISTEEESSYLKRNLHLIAPDLTYAQDVYKRQPQDYR